MTRSRRQLSFTAVAEKTEEGNECTLCLSGHTQLSSPESWKGILAKEYAYSQLHLTQQSLVCQLCRDDIRKLLMDPSSTPRWKKMGEKVKWCIHMCTNKAHVRTKLFTREQVAQAFHSENVPFPTPMCKNHYHVMYDSLHSKQTQCYTCGSSLRGVQTRTCPAAEKIQCYLAEKTGFEGEIPPDAKVCMTCYKARLVIINCLGPKLIIHATSTYIT